MSNGTSGFDPQAFLNMTFTDASSTERIPVPAGEHVAVAKKVETRAWTGKQDSSKKGMALDVQWSIDDPNVKSLLGRDEVLITQGLMLDLTPAGGLDFAKGRNVDLGRLRDATGLNEPGKPFSFPMIEGKVARIMVSHQPSTRPGARPGDVFENVNGVAKA